MEDKTFELLEKMYGELLSFKTNVNERFDGVEKRLYDVENEIKKLGATVDGEVKTKISSLYDGYITNTEKLDVIEGKTDVISAQQENLKHEVAEIKGEVNSMIKQINSNSYINSYCCLFLC